ncbi:MAG TPA: hypothetical protein VD770_01725, partial [Coxiellaceae bacterium]|nr:hypothetical protein [Coxiellaceae bacterium]
SNNILGLSNYFNSYKVRPLFNKIYENYMVLIFNNKKTLIEFTNFMKIFYENLDFYDLNTECNRINSLTFKDRLGNSYSFIDVVLFYKDDAPLLYQLIENKILNASSIRTLSKKIPATHESFLKIMLNQNDLEAALTTFRSAIYGGSSWYFYFNEYNIDTDEVNMQKINLLVTGFKVIGARLNSETPANILKRYFELLNLFKKSYGVIADFSIPDKLISTLAVRNEQGHHLAMIVAKNKEYLDTYLDLIAHCLRKPEEHAKLKELFSTKATTTEGTSISFADLIVEHYKDDPTLLAKIAAQDILSDDELIKVLIAYWNTTKTNHLSKEFKFTDFPQAALRLINLKPSEETLKLLLPFKPKVANALLEQINQSFNDGSTSLEDSITTLKDALGLDNKGASIAPETRSPLCQYLYINRGPKDCTPESGSMADLNKRLQELKKLAAAPLHERLSATLLANPSTLFTANAGAGIAMHSLNADKISPAAATTNTSSISSWFLKR